MNKVSIHIAVENQEEMREALRQYQDLPNLSCISAEIIPIDDRASAQPEAGLVHDDNTVTASDIVNGTVKVEGDKLAKAPAEEPSAPEPAEVTHEPDPAEPAHIYSEMEVRAAVAELRDSKGINAVKAVFAKFCVSKFPELEPEQYTDVMAVVKEAMGDAT